MRYMQPLCCFFLVSLYPPERNEARNPIGSTWSSGNNNRNFPDNQSLWFWWLKQWCSFTQDGPGIRSALKVAVWMWQCVLRRAFTRIIIYRRHQFRPAASTWNVGFGIRLTQILGQGGKVASSLRSSETENRGASKHQIVPDAGPFLSCIDSIIKGGRLYAWIQIDQHFQIVWDYPKAMAYIVINCSQAVLYHTVIVWDIKGFILQMPSMYPFNFPSASSFTGLSYTPFQGRRPFFPWKLSGEGTMPV